jgi:TPR repeat protein
VPRDPERAAEWHERAASQGLANAQYQMGLLYEHGEGVPRDDVAAAHWHRRAAEQGEVAAQTNLGLMYRDGRGVPQDDALAYAWLSIAAETADPALRDDRAVLARAQLMRRMSAADLAAGQAKVQALRRRGNSAP